MPVYSNFALRHLFVLCLLLLNAAPAYAQSVEVWEKELTRTDISTERRIDLLNLLARDLSYVRPVSSIQYASQALQLSQESNYQRGMAYAYRNMASSYSYYGSFYLTMSNLQKAIPIFESLGDSAGIANCHISLGHTYRRLLNREEEIINHRRSYEIFTKLGIPDRIGVTAHNLGESYLNNGQLKESEALTLKAIRLLDSLQNLSVLSSCYKVMGKIFLERRSYDSATAYFNKVLQLTKKLGANSQKVATIESLIALASIYEINGKPAQSLASLNEAAAFVRANQLTDYVKPVYMDLIRAYTARDMHDDVLRAVKEFSETEDALTKQQLEDRGKMMQTVAQVFELEKKYNQLNEKSIVQQQHIRDRNLLLIVSSFSAVVLLILIVSLNRNIKKLQRSNQILLEQEALIRKQNEQLKELNATKDKFFSIVSHDLRAPLNSLWSFSSLVTEGIDKLSREELLKFSTELKRLVELTMKMTDNLIAWAKVQMKEFVFNPAAVQLSGFLHEECRIYEDIARDKNLQLNYDIAPSAAVMADANQLSFIIRNLVNNAIKYSHAGGSIRISSGTQNLQTFVSVHDSGLGMDGETIQKIFSAEPLQSSRGTAGETGTGLGLKLCREFALINGGRLEVESEPGKGSVFTLWLPAASPVAS